MPELPQPRESLKFNARALDYSITGHDNTKPDLLRFGPQSTDPCYCVTTSKNNWRRGIIKRCAHAENKTNPKLLIEFYKFVHGIIKKLPILEGGHDFFELREDWLLNSNYSAKRREFLRKSGLKVLNGEVSKHRLYQCKSFIKREFYGEMKEPRIINSRSDFFKAVAGPFIHAIEKLVYDEHFIKHMHPDEVAAKMTDLAQGYDLFYETDYSSFEGSFTLDFQKHVELAMFKHCLANYPEATSLIEGAYSTNYLHYGDVGCSFDGSRMSGDMWTSLANGFSNYCICKFMMMKSGSYGNFLVEGDDGYIACTREIDFTIARDLGFKLKVEPRTNHRDISFCSLHVCDGRIVPDIRRTLNHFGSSCQLKIANLYQGTSKRSQRRFKQFIKSKALSLLAVGRGIPVLQEISLQLLRLHEGVGIHSQFIDWWERTFFDMSNIKPEPVTMSVREYVAKEFNIPVDLQYKIETAVRNCDYVCYDISLPAPK